MLDTTDRHFFSELSCWQSTGPPVFLAPPPHPSLYLGRIDLHEKPQCLFCLQGVEGKRLESVRLGFAVCLHRTYLCPIGAAWPLQVDPWLLRNLSLDHSNLAMQCFCISLRLSQVPVLYDTWLPFPAVDGMGAMVSSARAKSPNLRGAGQDQMRMITTLPRLPQFATPTKDTSGPSGQKVLSEK